MQTCVIVLLLLAAVAHSLLHGSGWRSHQVTRLSPLFGEVELVFPNKKKVMAGSGTPLKAAAAKAGFKPNYACEEGKCGSCELICNGKTKIRPCIGKVPGSATTLTNP